MGACRHTALTDETQTGLHDVSSSERVKEGNIMSRRIRWVFGASLIAASMALAGVAVATGSTGSVLSEVIGAGSMPSGMGFVATPGTTTVVADFTFGANSSTGWHTHPGKTLVTVKAGTFTVYHAKDCAPSVYGPGDAFVELPSSVHVGRNETGDTVELGVVFFGVPAGGSPRIDQPQPANCELT
jgi:quercetin dioxygenase-like cupin family protein